MDITDIYTVINLLTSAEKSREVTLNIKNPPKFFFFLQLYLKIEFQNLR